MIGEVLMVPVEEILSTWDSVDADCDCGSPCKCEWCVKYREDNGLPDLDERDDSERCGWCVHDERRRDAWATLLDEKRHDWQYDHVVDSLRDRGFLRPNTFFVNEKGRKVHGDGHHRLAAAIDLGVTHLPYELRQGYGDCIAGDSGSWEAGSPVPRTNTHDDVCDDCGYCTCECEAA